MTGSVLSTRWTPSQARYNVVIMGKTGVGKSALINYLFGYKKAEQGAGKPVTKRGFWAHDIEINKLPVRLFDSWGLEPGKDREWEQELEKEFAKRGTRQPVREWFHTVFYCFAAGGARVEDFELRIIKRFQEKKNKVTIILTKSDLASDREKEAIENTLRQALSHNIKIIRVCSESKVLLGGRKTEQYGKDEVEEQTYKDFWETIVTRLPIRCHSLVNEQIDVWYDDMRTMILEETGFWNDIDIAEKLKDELESFQHDLVSVIKDEIANTFEVYKLFSDHLGYFRSFNRAMGKLKTSIPEEKEGFFDIVKGFLAGLIFGPIFFLTLKIFNKKYLLERLEKIKLEMVTKTINIERDVRMYLVSIESRELNKRDNAKWKILPN